MEAELGQSIQIAKETGIQGRANKRSHGSMDKQLFPLNWLSFSSPFKILAIKEKLSLAWLLDWKKLIVETNSLFASGGPLFPNSVFLIITYIFDLTRFLSRFKKRCLRKSRNGESIVLHKLSTLHKNDKEFAFFLKKTSIAS